MSTIMADAYCGSAERGDPGQVPADDEGLDTVGSLVGVDNFHVGEVPGNVMLDEQPVAAEDVAGVQADLAALLGVVHLGQRRHRPGEPALAMACPSDSQAAPARVAVRTRVASRKERAPSSQFSARTRTSRRTTSGCQTARLPILPV